MPINYDFDERELERLAGVLRESCMWQIGWGDESKDRVYREARQLSRKLDSATQAFSSACYITLLIQ